MPQKLPNKGSRNLAVDSTTAINVIINSWSEYHIDL